MNITLVISSLRGGGAERVMSVMANYWVTRGKNVTLITLDSKLSDAYRIDPRVRRIGLDLVKKSKTPLVALKNNIVRIIKLRKAIQEYKGEVVISFIDHMSITTLLAVLGTHIKVIISERNDPRQYTIGPVWEKLRRWSYPRADALVVQTIAVSNWARGLVSGSIVRVIPNPVPLIETNIGIDSPLKDRSPFIVSMGRLVHQKGFDQLLEAFSICRNWHKNWSLIIMGEGPKRDELEKLANRLGIKESVIFMGWTKDPYTVLQQAEFYVLSSRYEGFPNALLEAMSCGLPVISYDCPSGPSDIINHGENGLLLPQGDLEAMVASIKRLMENKKERQRMGSCAREVVKKYSVEKVMMQWDRLLVDVMDKGNTKELNQQELM